MGGRPPVSPAGSVLPAGPPPPRGPQLPGCPPRRSAPGRKRLRGPMTPMVIFTSSGACVQLPACRPPGIPWASWARVSATETPPALLPPLLPRYPPAPIQNHPLLSFPSTLSLPTRGPISWPASGRGKALPTVTVVTAEPGPLSSAQPSRQLPWPGQLCCCAVPILRTQPAWACLVTALWPPVSWDEASAWLSRPTRLDPTYVSDGSSPPACWPPGFCTSCSLWHNAVPCVLSLGSLCPVWEAP